MAGAFLEFGFHPNAQLAHRRTRCIAVEGDVFVVILLTVDRAERSQHVKVLKLVWQRMTSLCQ